MNLSKAQIEELVYTNKYQTDPSKKLLSRCMEGGYVNNENLYPLAIAGADLGDLAVLYATANAYGFEIQEDKAFKTFVEIIGGFQNFSFHSPTECGHMKEVTKDPQLYSLDQDQIQLINSQIATAEKNGAVKTVLKEKSPEGAVIQISGEWNMYPQYHMTTAKGTVPVQVFIFHKTLVDYRHKILSKKLIENKAVTLFDDLDEEYLYQVLSSITEDHFFETIKRIAAGLPMYEVKFESNGGCEIKDLGTV